MNNEPIEEQTINENSWIMEELKAQQNNKPMERKPALKLEENKIYELEIDFSKPWDKWINPEDGNVKKIIPIKYGGVDHVWFLSVKNPTFRELLEGGRTGQNCYKIMRTGQAKQTRYLIIK